METKSCLVCQEEFTTNRSYQKYCSKRCRGKANKNKYIAKLKIKECEGCNINFKTGRSFQKYCSKECQAKACYIAKLKTKECEVCGASFQTGRLLQKYCSKECRHIVNRMQSLKRNKSSVKWRYRIFERDNFCCIYCGRKTFKDLSVELHIDHIKPKSQGGNNTLGNLVTSCIDCNLGKSDRRLRSELEQEILAEVSKRNQANNYDNGLNLPSNLS